jgi:hypothetical protein
LSDAAEDKQCGNPENGRGAAITEKVPRRFPASADQVGQRATLQPDAPGHISQEEKVTENDRHIKGIRE